MKKKVILTGNFGVGKTSLFNRFLYSQFNEKYLTTIGVKVDKKTLCIDGEEVILLIWDIAGEISQDKVPVSFYLGSGAIIYVLDLTRPSTYVNLKSDLDYLEKMVPDAPIRIVANKLDLVNSVELENLKTQITPPPTIFTSAKSGENVDFLFTDLAKELIANAKI